MDPVIEPQALDSEEGRSATASRHPRPRRWHSLTLRELCLVVLCVSIGLGWWTQVSTVRGRPALNRSLHHVGQPVRYRYWHQRGNQGSGSGTLGSGSEWKTATRLDFFENYILVHEPDHSRMIPLKDLTYFDWMLAPNPSPATPTPTAGH